jgi:hypothetical protein
MSKSSRRVQQSDFMQIKDNIPPEADDWFTSLCSPSFAARLNKAIEVELQYQAEEQAYESAKAKRNKQTPPKPMSNGFCTKRESRRRQEKAAALGMNVSQYVRYKKAQKQNSNAEQ